MARCLPGLLLLSGMSLMTILVAPWGCVSWPLVLSLLASIAFSQLCRVVRRGRACLRCWTRPRSSALTPARPLRRSWDAERHPAASPATSSRQLPRSQYGVRDAACPISTGWGARRVHLVRRGGGGPLTSPRSALPAAGPLTVRATAAGLTPRGGAQIRGDLFGEPVARVAAGLGHSAAVTARGRAFSWGGRSFGAPGSVRRVACGDGRCEWWEQEVTPRPRG